MINNVERAFVGLYNKVGHEVQNFGNVTIAYAKVENADFNLIMNLNSSSTLLEDLPNIDKSLAFAASKPHPFAFVQLRKDNYDLSDITSRHKFQLAGQANCVLLDHADYTYTAKVSSEYRLVKVSDAKSLDDWCNVLDSSFSLKPGCVSSVYQPALSFIAEENSSVALYTLYNSDNTPTSAAMIYFDPNSNDIAGHYCWGTKSEFRNQGAMTYLTNEMVNIAKKRGYKQSTAQCYDTSIRLAQKLGFKPSGDMFDIYIHSV